MKRYCMKLIVRPNPDCGLIEYYSAETETKCNATAKNQVVARRIALEQAWASGLLVSRFTKIEEKRLA